MQGCHRSAAEAQAQVVREEWGTLNWLANQSLTGSRDVTVGRVVIHRGRHNPRHCHPSCEEVLHLLTGKLEHTLGDDVVTMNAGDTLHIPAGIYHNAINIGGEDAEMIVAYSTGRRDFQLERAGAAERVGR